MRSCSRPIRVLRRLEISLRPRSVAAGALPEMLQTELGRDMAMCGELNVKSLDPTVIKITSEVPREPNALTAPPRDRDYPFKWLGNSIRRNQARGSMRVAARAGGVAGDQRSKHPESLFRCLPRSESTQFAVSHPVGKE